MTRLEIKVPITMNSPRLDYHTIKRHKDDSKSPYQKPKFSWALRELLKDYLTEKKLDVYVCDDFENAREIIQYFIFDLIILDKMMPSGDGIKLVSTIKKISTMNKEKNPTPKKS